MKQFCVTLETRYAVAATDADQAIEKIKTALEGERFGEEIAVGDIDIISITEEKT